MRFARILTSWVYASVLLYLVFALWVGLQNDEYLGYAVMGLRRPWFGLTWIGAVVAFGAALRGIMRGPRPRRQRDIITCIVAAVPVIALAGVAVWFLDLVR